MVDIPFYESIPAITRFQESTDPTRYLPLPDDWYVAVTDIRNSTQAIESGKYKEVNAVGAIAIMGVVNLTGKFNFPFVFGGDGAAIAIPENLKDNVRSTIAAVQINARENFGLELNAGIIPVSAIRKAGFDVRVARLQVSNYYYQALFIGGGLPYAENLIKTPDLPDAYRIDSERDAADANFNGMECRWDEVTNDRGEVHSMLIEAQTDDPSQRAAIYQEVLARIHNIYGEDENFRPITQEKLALTLKNRNLSVEHRIRTHRGNKKEKIHYWVKLRIQWLLGKFLMHFGIKTEITNWGQYRQDLVENTDYRKFDDMLRLVVAGSEMQRFTMQGYLEDQLEKGKLVYGLHHSRSALITCVILNHQEGHIHLVDGSEGGYALAAKKMKTKKRVLDSIKQKPS